jgi:hypothetical protein
MKSNISRQSIYMLTTSLVLVVFVLVFSIMFLIPEGKKYRIHRDVLKKESLELKQLTQAYEKTDAELKKLQHDNSRIIKAFDKPFDAQKFEKQYKVFFTSLKVSKKEKLENEDDFDVYEINTTSTIDSPKNFYDFLDSINKSDWIIGVNFPIEFKKDDSNIRSSFNMRVYNDIKDSKVTTHAKH